MITAKVSLVAQIAFTLLTFGGVLVHVDEEDAILRQVAILETSSQAVEFAYYALVVFYFGGIRTWTRYLDWVVSTPLMIVSFAAFFVHRASLREELEEEDSLSSRNLSDVFGAGRGEYLAAALATNTAMLLAGFLIETGTVRRRTWKAMVTLFAFCAFLVTFVLLHVGYVLPRPGEERADIVSVMLLLFVYVVWGMYGAALFLDDVPKNVMYNALDVVSKNFYGVFVFAYILIR